MKKTGALMLALVLLLTGVLSLFSGCAAKPKIEDVYDRVVELVERSDELNTLFYGAGLPVYKTDSDYARFSNLYYGFQDKGVYEYVKPYAKFATIDQMKESARKVYSTAYLEKVVFPALFDGYAIQGVSGVQVEVARYMENASWIYQAAAKDQHYQGIIVYDYASMEIVPPTKADACYVEMNAFMENTPDKVKRITLRLVKQEDGQWYLDSFTGGVL